MHDASPALRRSSACSSPLPPLALSGAASHEAVPAERTLSGMVEGARGQVGSGAALMQSAESPSSNLGEAQRGQDQWGEHLGSRGMRASARQPEAASESSGSGLWLAEIEGQASWEDLSGVPDLILREYLRRAQEIAAPPTPGSTMSCATGGNSSFGSRPSTPKSLSTPNSTPSGQQGSNAMWGAGTGWWASNEYPALGGGSMPSTPDSVDSRGSSVRGAGAWGASFTKKVGVASTPGTPSGNRDYRGTSGGGAGAAGLGAEDCSMDKYDLDRFEEHHTVFEEHLSFDEAQRLVKTRALYSGTLHVDPNTLRASVCVDGPGMIQIYFHWCFMTVLCPSSFLPKMAGSSVNEEILIEGWFARNRALHGDKVAVKLLDDDTHTRDAFDSVLTTRSARPPARALENRRGSWGGGGGPRGDLAFRQPCLLCTASRRSPATPPPEAPRPSQA